MLNILWVNEYSWYIKYYVDYLVLKLGIPIPLFELNKTFRHVYLENKKGNIEQNS